MYLSYTVNLRYIFNMPNSILDFPGGSVSKESTCNAGDCLQSRRPRFNPCARKIPWRRKWQPTPVFLPGESHGERSLADYSPGVTKNRLLPPPAPQFHLETNVDVVVQSPSCVRLCNPMDCITPVFPVSHHLLEFAQVHVHWISDANDLTVSNIWFVLKYLLNNHPLTLQEKKTKMIIFLWVWTKSISILHFFLTSLTKTYTFFLTSRIVEFNSILTVLSAFFRIIFRKASTLMYILPL